MSKRVFVDTGAFIALANTGDQYHLQAVECFKKLRTPGTLFLTTNFVLDETYTRLARKAGLHVALAFGQKIQSSRHVKIYTVEKTLGKIAWDIFAHSKGQTFSYTDCTSFALMRRRKIKEAFTFDDDYRSFGWMVYP